MAGIFASVDSDIKKLHLLREEIENIKKALKGINVKVDIDIAKGLEARLKSLSEQYDALVTKVSEAEGKILISTKRINDAAEKIVKAQEQVSKNMGVSPSNSNTVNTTANNTETASVQAQAKAYDDLANEINSIIGTREQNIKRMLEEQNAIRLINAEIKQLTKHQSNNQALSINQQKRLEQLNNLLLTHKAALAEVRQALNNNAKLDNAAATSMDALSQSLGRMRTTYRQLTEEERNSPFGRELLASINQADAKIKSLDSTIGVHARNVGNYASGWNGLNMSIQQVGRELPSLAVSWNTFFLAISNNLPILADEIKRAKIQYEALKNSGQKAVPVWKQVVSSIFSWQSALTVGITLLTLYGGKVVDWIAGLFGADSAQKRLNESVKEFNSIISKEETNTRVLFDAIKKTNEGTQGRADAIKKINDSYGKYLPSLLSEKSSLLEIEQAYKNVNKALMENAALKAQKNAIDKVVEDSLKVQSDALSEIQKGAGNKNSKAITDIVLGWTEDFHRAGQTWQQAFNAIAENIQKRFGEMPNGFYGALEDYIKSVYESNREISKIQEKYNPFFDEKESNKAIIKNKEYWETQKMIAEENLSKISSSQKRVMDTGNFKGIDTAVVKSYKDNIKKLREAEKELKVYDSPIKQESQVSKQADKQLKQQEQLAEEFLSLRRKNQQDEINLMEDGTEKKLAQINLDYQKELDTIRKQEREWSKANGGKLTKEQSIQISLSYSQAESKRDKSISDVNKEELEAMNRYLKEYGTFQQKKEAITKEYNEKIARATTEGDKKIFQEEMEEALQSLDLSELKQSMDWEQVFGNLDKVSTDTLKRLKEDLKDFISIQKDLSPESLKELVDAIEQIDEKVSERNPFEFMATSFKSLKDATEAERKAQEAYNKTLKEGTDEEKKNAKATLESAKNNKQKALSEATNALHKGVDEIGQYVEAGNQVIGIMETLGVKTPQWLEGTMSGFGEILDGLGSIDLMKPMSIVTGGLQTIKGALTSVISLGGLIPGISADYSEYNAMVEKYDNLLNVWDELIAKKKEYIDISYGSEALKAGEEALLLLENQKDAVGKLLNSYASSGSGWFSHSKGYKFMETNFDGDTWQKAIQAVNKEFGTSYDKGATQSLSAMTAEQLQYIKEHFSGLWSVSDSTITGYLENLIDYGEQADEIVMQLKESVTGMSFDEFKSGYADLLSDLDSTNEDFAENFEKYLQKAIFQSLLANEYKDQIQKLYDTWAEYGEDGLTSDEAQRLRNMQQQLTNSLLSERDKLMQDFGWETESDSTREASQKGIATASQDSVDENNGRLAVIQSHTYTLNENVSRMANGIESLLSYSFANLSSTTNIDKTAKAIESQSRDALNHLANIDNYTSNLVEIKEYMYAMKSGIDTLNTKGIALKR